jgi:hypothetical protein
MEAALAAVHLDGAGAEGEAGPLGGEEGAWDDSALVDAYEDAVRRYQRAHGLTASGAWRALLCACVRVHVRAMCCEMCGVCVRACCG